MFLSEETKKYPRKASGSISDFQTEILIQDMPYNK
jgi:hypothetical protein